MTESEAREAVAYLLDQAASDGPDYAWVESVGTFADAGLMTHDDGLVLRCDDGSEFSD